MAKLAPALVLSAVVGVIVGTSPTAHPLTAPAWSVDTFNPAAILDPLQVERPSIGLAIHPAGDLAGPVVVVGDDVAYVAAMVADGWRLLPAGSVVDPDGMPRDTCLAWPESGMVACSDGYLTEP